MTRIALLLLLAGCADAAPEPVSEPVRAPYAVTCPQGAPAPPAPRAPRTVESIAAYARAAEKARAQTEAARAICARRLADVVSRLP